MSSRHQSFTNKSSNLSYEPFKKKVKTIIVLFVSLDTSSILVRAWYGKFQKKTLLYGGWVKFCMSCKDDKFRTYVFEHSRTSSIQGGLIISIEHNENGAISIAFFTHQLVSNPCSTCTTSCETELLFQARSMQQIAMVLRYFGKTKKSCFLISLISDPEMLTRLWKRT